MSRPRSAAFLEGCVANRPRAANLVRTGEVDLSPASPTAARLDSDPLLALFLRGGSFSPEEFLNELAAHAEACANPFHWP